MRSVCAWRWVHAPTLAAVALLLVVVAGAASYLPALRAAATPPLQVLREE